MDGPAPSAYDRCPKCRYNIRGITEAVCPECGDSIEPEFVRREVDRIVRRRRKFALIVLLSSAPLATLLMIILKYAGVTENPPIEWVLFVALACAEWYMWVRADPSVGPKKRARGALVMAPLLAVGYGLLCLAIWSLVAHLLRAAFL